MGQLLGGRSGSPPGLRKLIETSPPVLAPGCFDALGARLIEQAGFPAVYMTGFGTSAGLIGRPDVGLVSMSEMADNARRIVEAVGLPVIADADTGYGNPINVLRTVREYERAGVAALHIEDQVAPKKCGHMEGKHVVAPEEMVEKVRAAVDARISSEFLIIARTDARAVEGLGAAIERAGRYREAGADVLFVEAPQSVDEIRSIASAFPSVPLLFNYAEGGKTPPIEHSLLAELGYAIVIFPIATLLAATRAMQDVLARIRADGSPINVLPTLPRFAEFLDLIGLPEIRELEQRYNHTRQEEKT